MPERLTDIYDNLNTLEKADNKLCDVILHLSKLIKNWQKDRSKIPELARKNEQIIIFNPLNPDLEEILEKITNEDKELPEPFKYIQFSFSEKTRQGLNN